MVEYPSSLWGKDWSNFSVNAIRCESKREIKKRIKIKWDSFKLKKIKVDSLCINYHNVFHLEFKALSHYKMKILNKLRTGHNELKGQKKFGNLDKNCGTCNRI